MSRAAAIGAVLVAMSLAALQTMAAGSDALAGKVQELLTDFLETYDTRGRQSLSLCRTGASWTRPSDWRM